MSLTATLTLLLPLLRTAVERGVLGSGSRHDAILSRAATLPAGAPSRCRARSWPAIAAHRLLHLVGPIAPMQPTRKVSSCVSLPG